MLANLVSCQSEPKGTFDFKPETVSLGLERIGNGRFDNPVLLTHPPDQSGRIFVVEKMGKVQTFSRDGQVSSYPFLNIVNGTNNGDLEEGLLGFAFEPNYRTNPRFYAYYIRRPGREARGRDIGREREAVLVRYTLTDPKASYADPVSEEILLRIHQPDTNHNGGMLAFGPDGMLYFGLGDGGGRGDNFGNAQNPNTLLGSILRLDVSGTKGYEVPSDNPWAGRDDVRPEIWAMGLRNPWRFHFHPQRRDLYIGDIGESNIEEVNIRRWDAKGVPNFGWPIMEGSQCYPEPHGCSKQGFHQPVHSYPHNEGNCAIIAGPVYQGRSMPKLSGVMLFGDYCSGNIWGLWKGESGWKTAILVKSNSRISSFGEDETGEILVADLNGYVFRLVSK